ncbi:hypothetical protein BN13_160005 [Nostocoides jenkinsii Ben 74]|uniref:Uncharacterized protein n=1 Tax=Nostocoides jenkinsii Ben 74 TaxID=1193518 RepID=A0A077MC89_9MICO|nr:hypothetical protein BN13_160005 [Tetrasphaera jenkinsii Ben 74]
MRSSTAKVPIAIVAFTANGHDAGSRNIGTTSIAVTLPLLPSPAVAESVAGTEGTVALVIHRPLKQQSRRLFRGRRALGIRWRGSSPHLPRKPRDRSLSARARSRDHPPRVESQRDDLSDQHAAVHGRRNPRGGGSATPPRPRPRRRHRVAHAD